jgi:RND family efflux transporter MFP subunit
MKKMTKRLLQVVLVIVLIIAGGMGNWLLKASRPPVEKEKPKVALPLARTVAIHAETIPVPIQGHGTVRPLQEIQLVPQVGGKVIYMSPALVDGGAFKKGDILLKIDPSDYLIAVTLAEARVKDAESRFILAEQESQVARSEWHELHPDSDPPSLVAKKPQLETALANLAAQKAELERARLNFERTLLNAPFNGRISQKSVDIGQYISPGAPVAALYSIDAAEIVLPMESEKLEWFHVPEFTPGCTQGARANIKTDIAGVEQIWEGIVVRAEGKVDEKTRMINVVVRIDQPHSRKPPLVPGLFVTVDIEGKSIENGVLIPREALRQNNVVWVVDEKNRLVFKTVEVALYTHSGIVVKKGLLGNEHVVVAPIKEVTDGMAVRNVAANNGGSEK